MHAARAGGTASASAIRVAALERDLDASLAKIAALEAELHRLRSNEKNATVGTPGDPQPVTKPDASDYAKKAIWAIRMGDYETALPNLRIAADMGDNAAVSNLGAMYLNGTAVPQDTNQAIALFERAANAGNRVAVENLGAVYEIGLGILPNRTRAIQWYERAGELGSTKASTALDRLRKT